MYVAVKVAYYQVLFAILVYVVDEWSCISAHIYGIAVVISKLQLLQHPHRLCGIAGGHILKIRQGTIRVTNDHIVLPVIIYITEAGRCSLEVITIQPQKICSLQGKRRATRSARIHIVRHPAAQCTATLPVSIRANEQVGLAVMIIIV